MFAKPNEIGSAESLTTEIENVAGSLRLNVALPFEARRYEFSLPAGEESLDGSNEDEVPVLRRVIDTHTGEVIRTTSLPTVIKEVLIARYGGAISGNEWFSARATLSASIGASDDEVRNAIEEFEASEPTIMADGGRERLPRFCPNDDERLVPREEEPLEVECPECGYSSPRNLRGETVKVCHKKASISENSRGENEAYMATLEIGGIENRIAVTREFVREAVTEDDEPEVMTDGGHRRVPESGEEGTLTVVEEASGEYVELSGEVDHASRCESRVYDGENDETGFMAEGVAGYLDVDGRRISFNTASDRVTEHHPEAEEAEDAVEFVGALVEAEFENDGELMTDGGEEPTESGEESEEPPRWRDWSNVREERNSERLMTDGGSRVHPDDEGVELLDEPNNDDDIIDAGDDGEIISDGGFDDGDWRVVETQPEVPDWERVKVKGISEEDAREYARNLNSGPSGRAGYLYEAEEMPDAGDDEQLMTDGGEEELPDLSGLEGGNEVRVFYLYQRSGNEVKREGTVSSVIESDDKRIVRIHAGNPEPLKHKFVSAMEATTESGREGVFVWSQTATAEMPFDGAPKVGKPYSVKFEFSRTSILGEVDRIVRTDRSTPIMMTDGGRPRPSRREPYTVECKEEDCSFAAGPLEFGKVNRKEAEHYIETADADGSNGHRLRVRQHMPDSARDSGQYEPAEYEHRIVVCFDCGSIIQHFHKEPGKDYSIDTQADRHRERHLEHYRNPPEGASGEPVREPSEHTVIILDASNDRPTIDCR